MRQPKTQTFTPQHQPPDYMTQQKLQGSRQLPVTWLTPSQLHHDLHSTTNVQTALLRQLMPCPL